MQLIGMVVVSTGLLNGVASSNVDLCRAKVVCTMLSGLDCNRSGGGCPPCIYQRTVDALDCRKKTAVELGCPNIALPLLIDCDTIVPTTTPNTVLQQISIEQANSGNNTSSNNTRNPTTLPPNGGSSTISIGPVGQSTNNSAVYWVVGISMGVCLLLVGLCCLRRRSPKRQRHAPNVESVHKIKRQQANADELPIPAPLILVSESLRYDLLNSYPDQSTQAIVSASGTPSSTEDDDILSTVFMRFRTTADYAADERNSVFSMLSSMDSSTLSSMGSLDTVHRDEDEVDI
ncbi:hypothetical protein H257_19064 [Aphanomyces astaci]|uniref:Uncharacterized protein n=1 Tax=Aphanomyces astaci TaxID=112090 RepID=W4FB08_APHAT|nr:hypothetical protein H257_19064 [Aphanomyces astaci]ETV64001.1 hypothetical protein H257_19064 [Aphanomyces astaci]|eukprot:XP_009846515.1 hypothetical protein H257_19064 [Aphanomyces astaci]